MKELIPCDYCSSLISNTALLCPICLKTKDIKESKIGSSTPKAIIFGMGAIVFSKVDPLVKTFFSQS